MRSKLELLLAQTAVRLGALAVMSIIIVVLHRAGVVRLLTWTQSILSADQRPVLFTGFVVTAIALIGAEGARRRLILVVASMAAMASFSVSFLLLSVGFFWAHYNVVFARIHHRWKLAFLLGTYLAWGIACDTLLWPDWLGATPAVLVFGYVFAVTYTFRLFYFHHEMRLRAFERVPFSSYFLYIAFAPYFIILPYMMAIPRYRDFAKYIDKADPQAETRGVTLLIAGVLYATAWHLVVLAFDPKAAVTEYAAHSQWSAAAGLALLYAPYTFLSIVGDALILIGLINALGVRIRPPFNRPLAAQSVLEWWRRWNTHFRDFLVDVFYYPLLVKWRKRNRYATIITACFLVFVVGSTFFHWTAKYYFTYASHERIMWGVTAENVFMFVVVALALCLEERRKLARRVRPRPSLMKQLGLIARTWLVLAIAVVFIGRGVQLYFNPIEHSPQTSTSEVPGKENPTMQQEYIRRAIRDFVGEISAAPLQRDTDDLIETGVIDSIRVLDLINFVADTFGMDVSERDIYDGKFASVQTVTEFVAAGQS